MYFIKKDMYLFTDTDNACIHVYSRTVKHIR